MNYFAKFEKSYLIVQSYQVLWLSKSNARVKPGGGGGGFFAPSHIK